MRRIRSKGGSWVGHTSVRWTIQVQCVAVPRVMQHLLVLAVLLAVQVHRCSVVSVATTVVKVSMIGVKRRRVSNVRLIGFGLEVVRILLLCSRTVFVLLDCNCNLLLLLFLMSLLVVIYLVLVVGVGVVMRLERVLPIRVIELEWVIIHHTVIHVMLVMMNLIVVYILLLVVSQSVVSRLVGQFGFIHLILGQLLYINMLLG